MVVSYYGTGRRKTAVARVWLRESSEPTYTVNGKSFMDYFRDPLALIKVEKPFEVTETKGRFSVLATIRGGGKSSQVEALRHGIARALLNVDPSYRLPLKKAGYLTRDPRMKERKKYGMAGARKRYQYSKR